MDKMNVFKGIADAELVKMFAEGREMAFAELVARHFAQARKTAMYFVKDCGEAGCLVDDAFLTVSQAIRKGAYSEQGLFKSFLMRTVRFKALDYYRKNTKAVGDDQSTAILQGITTKRNGEIMDLSDSENEAMLNGEAVSDFLLNGFMDQTDGDDNADYDCGSLVAEDCEERLTMIETAVHTLPELQRDIFCLRHSGMLYAEWKVLNEAQDPSLAGREGVKFADIVSILGLKSVNTATSSYQYALKNIKKAVAAQICKAA